MTLEDALREITSDDFAARLAIASDLRMFLRIASKQTSVRSVLAQMDSEENRRRILKQVLQLLRLDVDYRYENPWDTAIAVLLWILARRTPQLGVLAAQAALEAPQCWWVPRIVEDMLRDSVAANPTRDLRRPEGIFTQFASCDAEATYFRRFLAWRMLVNADMQPYASFSVKSVTHSQPLEQKSLLTLTAAEAQAQWVGPIATRLTYA